MGTHPIFESDFDCLTEMEREKRSRNKGSSARAAALAKIREARLTGETAEYELGEVENIFDEVNEDEYEDIKEKRADGWIVGDDQKGYYDDGGEFYDDSDEEKEMSKNEKKLESDRRKKMKFSKGSANITDMFLKNRKTKKTKVNVKINDDDDLNNIMREIDGTSASNVM